ncbi:hypothetical protein [Candidatus Electronema sp. PJ]|uniref:hypothetical protein n=1 Tax=Candidatus Electronema sp. PJ TaxID=3401572 RepID=UPI003AA84862
MQAYNEALQAAFFPFSAQNVLFSASCAAERLATTLFNGASERFFFYNAWALAKCPQKRKALQRMKQRFLF